MFLFHTFANHIQGIKTKHMYVFLLNVIHYFNMLNAKKQSNYELVKKTIK